MQNSKLLSLLAKYKPTGKKEIEARAQIITFINTIPDCFDNYCKHGHITASAWIVDLENTKVGLVHHKLFDKWLQPGGHSDGNSDTPQEALREAQEEFGTHGLSLESENIFDIDIHLIEQDLKRNLGPHFHYDVRFLILGNSNIIPKTSNESNQAIWVELDKVDSFNNEESFLRMIEKTKLRLMNK